MLTTTETAAARAAGKAAGTTAAIAISALLAGCAAAGDSAPVVAPAAVPAAVPAGAPVTAPAVLPAAKENTADSAPAPLQPLSSSELPVLTNAPAAGGPLANVPNTPALISRPRSSTEFSHPVLDQLLRNAAASSDAMLEQENFVAQNDPFRWRGWRQYMPYINAGYSMGKYKIFKSKFQDGSQMFNAAYSLSLRYPLFTWFSETAEKNAALLREDVTKRRAVQAWGYHANAIRREFFNAVSLRSQLVLKERQIALEKQRQENVAENLDVGVSSRTDALGASVALREKQFDYANTIVRLAESLTRLRTLSGVEMLAEKDIPASIVFPDVDCGALDRRLAQYLTAASNGETRDERIARLEREILDDEITMARSRQMPQFMLGASISQNPTDAGGTKGYEMRNIGFFGLTGHWNLFDRDITNTTVRALKTRQRLIDARLQTGKRARESALRSAIFQIRSTREYLAIRREHLASSERYLDRLREQLKLGLCRKMDVENYEAFVDTIRQSVAENEIAIARAYFEFVAGIEQDPAANYYTAPSNE